jgi:hypothetical protein
MEGKRKKEPEGEAVNAHDPMFPFVLFSAFPHTP